MHVFCGILLQQSELDTTMKRSILHMFADTRNIGYFVNSYTTKVGIGMEEFMKHLRAGIARKLQEIEDEETALRQTRKEFGTGPTSLPFSKKGSTDLDSDQHFLHASQARWRGAARLPNALWPHVLHDPSLLECVDEDSCLARDASVARNL